MSKIFLGNSVWNLVMQADLIAKLVLLLLACLSIICWTIFLYKLILFRIKKQQMNKMRSDIKGITTFEQLLAIASKHVGTLPGYFITKNLSFLKSILSSPDGGAKKELNANELEMIYHHAEQTIEDIVISEESYLSILSTTAQVAPLIGLFGTVWGLVHAFIGISAQQSADIATVAPGIAEALMTTLAGLFVAIPAFVMSSYCSAQVRTLDRFLAGLSDQFMIFVQRLTAK